MISKRYNKTTWRIIKQSRGEEIEQNNSKKNKLL